MDGQFNLGNMNAQALPFSTDEQMRELLEYFLSFTENLNLNIQFIVEQLGYDANSKEIGAKYKNMMNN